MSKPQQIDLQKEYPCPCCRGQINSLVLMEALGCNRCQKIFVLRENDYTLEQISNPYPHSWQWDGELWRSTKSSFYPISFSLGSAIIFSLGCIIASTWYFWTDSQVHQPVNKPLTREQPDR